MEVLLKLAVFLLVASSLSYVSYGRSSNSCIGKCDQRGTDHTAQCQCNEHCIKFTDCCSDYVSACVSCRGRCDDNEDPRKGCQCNSQCGRFGDCCEDYNDVCLPKLDTSKGKMSDAEMKQLAAQLWNLDFNSLLDNQYSMNIHGNKLFTHVDTDMLLLGTWPLFLNLLDNYNPFTGKTEPNCPKCRQEEELFLNAVLRTTVMETAWRTLAKHGFASGNLNSFKSELKQYWFLPYSRSGRHLDSSGFEHVFVGEIKNGNVIGFHNWLQFYRQEADGQLKFDRHINSCTPNTISVGLTWKGFTKSASSMLVATSPEFEMALYTMCFLARPNQICTVSYGGKTRKVSTYRMTGASKNTVATAHPLC